MGRFGMFYARRFKRYVLGREGKRYVLDGLVLHEEQHAGNPTNSLSVECGVRNWGCFLSLYFFLFHFSPIPTSVC